MLGKSQDASMNDINVSNQQELPTDTVSCISWLPTNNSRVFSTCSWDSKVRLYEVQVSGQQAKLALKGGFEVEDPCLSVAWCDDDNSKIFGGCVNGKVKVFDVTSGKHVDAGVHDGSIKSVYWVPKANVVLSLSHDKSARFWDLRSPQAAGAINLGYKAFCADYMFPYVLIGLSDERIAVMDLNNVQGLMGKTIDNFDSPLGKGSQVTCVAFASDGAGFGVGAHDGRANISKFTQSMGKMKSESIITFKTKSYPDSTPANKKILYPVHDIGFSALKKEFVFTSGGEGSICCWDFKKKDKLKTYDFGGVPVTRCKLSPDSQLMAYALGYDWSVGIGGYMSCPSRICVHAMQEGDFTGK